MENDDVVEKRGVMYHAWRRMFDLPIGYGTVGVARCGY